MPDYQFKRAVRENVPLLVGIAGGTGSGKTFSLLELAKGMTPEGKRFAFIDTEAGRGLAYADQFDFDYTELRPPFTPVRYIEVIEAADKAGYPVIVIDSFSHEYAGHGGLLDWHEQELDRMAGGDWQKRGALSVPAWSKPKQAHKQMMSDLLQIRAHLLFGLRAEEKLDMKKNEQTGRTEITEKVGRGGFKGWLPICEKDFPYELTCSFLLMADAPGVPKPIKLQAQHRGFFPTDRTISADAGAKLAEWARGGSPAPAASQVASQPTEQPAAKPAGRPQPQPPADNARSWDTQELRAALESRALSMGDLAVILGQPVTKTNAVHLIDLWLIDNPGKTVDDLALAALDAHMGGAPAGQPDAEPTAEPAEPQAALI